MECAALRIMDDQMTEESPNGSLRFAPVEREVLTADEAIVYLRLDVGKTPKAARAALDLTRSMLAGEGVELKFDKNPNNLSALEAELYKMEAEWNAARLLVQRAAWMADNKMPNSMEASMCKAKAGRMGTYVTLRCVELCQSLGYSENELLEKFARDSKILDIFEGTQQIQQLIVARRVLGKSSSELK